MLYDCNSAFNNTKTKIDSHFVAQHRYGSVLSLTRTLFSFDKMPLTVQISWWALHCGLPHPSLFSSLCIGAFLFITFITWSTLRELLMMNQFQALFESFLTTDGVPALTFGNEVRSPYLPGGGKEKIKKTDDLFSPQQDKRVNGQIEIQGCIARVNWICHLKKTKKKKTRWEADEV